MNWKNLWNNKSRLLSLWLAVMLLLLSGCSHIQPLEPGISDGGTLTKHLRALLASDFIVRYIPFGLSKREEHYKLIDPFCLFYLHFVQSQVRTNEKYWQQMLLHSQSLPGGATPLNMSALIMWNKSSMRWAYPVSLRPIPHSRKKTMTGRVYRSIC